MRGNTQNSSNPVRFTGLSGPVRRQVDPYGGRWSRTEAGGPVRRQVDPYGGRWSRTEASGSVRRQVVPYEAENARTVPGVSQA